MRGVDYLFVYGTLMNGMEAETLLTERDARPIGRGKIRGKLQDLGEFPGVVSSTDPRDIVYGEVYELPGPAVLSELDDYEDYHREDVPRSLFLRESVQVELLDQFGKSVTAWAYFYNERRGKLRGRRIRSGDYRLYRQQALARS